MRGSKHVKVKKRHCQDTLRFRADERKLILGSIGTPLDHLSVNPRLTKGGLLQPPLWFFSGSSKTLKKVTKGI